MDSIIGKQSSYLLKVNTTTNTVSVYARDGANGYIIPVKNMICSTGNPGTPTIHGTFTVKRLGRWWELMGPVWGQYVSQIYGGYLFHSAWYHVNGNNRTLSVSEYLKLGQNASHGCVRLTVADAKWIYDNCNGSTVTVYSSSSMDNKFDKPARPTPVAVSYTHLIGTEDQENVLKEVFPTLPSESIDYGVMEKASGIYILPGDFGWDDVGSWLAFDPLNGQP